MDSLLGQLLSQQQELCNDFDALQASSLGFFLAITILMDWSTHAPSAVKSSRAHVVCIGLFERLLGKLLGNPISK
jgi:hypothetical protein